MNPVEHSNSNPCVLLVDDHAALRALLRRALQAAGFDVLEAAGAASAARWLQRRRPQALVLSLQHAEAHGLQLLHWFRARDDLADVPIVFLAGGPTDDVRWQALRAGADWFTARPLSLRELQQRLFDLIRAGRPRLRIIASRTQPERKAG